MGGSKNIIKTGSVAFYTSKDRSPLGFILFLIRVFRSPFRALFLLFFDRSRCRLMPFDNNIQYNLLYSMRKKNGFRAGIWPFNLVCSRTESRQIRFWWWNMMMMITRREGDVNVTYLVVFGDDFWFQTLPVHVWGVLVFAITAIVAWQLFF